jgi:hypothetical protein
VTALPSVERLGLRSGQGMISGRELLSMIATILSDEAERIRQAQDAAAVCAHSDVWSEPRTAAYVGLCAGADVIERLVQGAKKAIADGQQPTKQALDCAEIARSALIVGLTKLQSKEPVQDVDSTA